MAAIVAGFAKKRPADEVGFIKTIVRLIATNKLERIVKNNKNLHTACTGVNPLSGVLSIIIYCCNDKAIHAVIAVMIINRMVAVFRFNAAGIMVG